MDRQIVYPGQIPLDTDILKGERNAMIGDAKLAHSLLGDGPFLNALACTPTSPASLQVQVAPGQIYQLASLDATAFGSLAADTTHQILKQGLLMDAVTLSCPAPGTAGQSINYLIQVGYLETDGGSAVLPYYNSANPAVAYNGPANAGTSQNTVRLGVCSVLVKAGTAATTGTQSTPAADAGYTGAYVVTVANGQTTIIAGNITTYVGAPFITDKLKDKITQAQGDVRYGQLTVSNTWTQPQVVPNATLTTHALNKGQADGLYQSPTGAVTMYGAAAAPSGWLNCDGAAVSRTTYSALFTVVGSTYGAGDGTTTFNLPNLKGRVPVGVGTGSGLTARTLAATGGEENHTLTVAEIPSHTHSGAETSAVNLVGGASGAYVRLTSDGTVTQTGSTGGGGGHNTMQPFLVLNFIIKT